MIPFMCKPYDRQLIAQRTDMLDAPTPLPAPMGVRRALWGSQLNQGLAPKLVLRAVARLNVHTCECPARRRATCGILVNIMSINSCPASRTGPPSLAGSTARLRINPTPSRAQRQDFTMMLAFRSNSLPRRLRVLFETRHESWSDGAGPASSATRMCGRSDHPAIHHAPRRPPSYCCDVFVYIRLRSNLAWRGVLGSQ